MKVIFPLIALFAIGAIIWYLGGGSFGRAQTQAWIDRARRFPRLYAFLNKHHGKFRASAHYIEFGGLFLVLYWLYDIIFSGGDFRFQWLPAIIIWIASAVAAYADEMHQLRSGTRQFRRVDFLHSCCGITIALAIIFLQGVIRGVN